MSAAIAKPRMSDDAVKAKTGKTWNNWFSLLDKAGAKKMSHQEIVKLLSDKFDVGPWWQQMITVNYEQWSGKRQAHERPEGFQISVSRSINVPVGNLYKSFANPSTRTRWLSENGLAVRTARPNESMRVTWADGETSLEINFYSKGEGKSQVVVQHSKLPNASRAAKMKTYWANALDRLREQLEELNAGSIP
ncbi:MAG: DUF4287 domain-containing protein [Pyrinomonadaceae bacterium]